MKFNFNFNSIKFRIWVYFLLFAVVLMILVWFLQIFFLNTYYEEMKIDQTKETALSIASKYQTGTLNNVLLEAAKVSDEDDIFIRIDEGTDTIFPREAVISYQKEISEVQKNIPDLQKNADQLTESNVSKVITNPETQKKTFVFALFLNRDEQIVMYVASPLIPVTSTIEILQNQLIIIIVIALSLAFILSLYLSTKISKPISSITRAARKLSDGQYGITFSTKSQYSEITNLAETLNKTSYELEKSVMLQKDLLANVSHDLRTPLTMIKSYAEMIRDLSGDIPEKREAHLQVIIEEADRLNILVSDMLALSRMQSGTMSLEISEFNIKEAVESIIRPYEILEAQEGFKIDFKCPSTLNVRGDEDKIKQVISNLLTNAIKYCGSDKKVFINIRRWGRKVHCEVIDHGVGIKPEELSHIWERYYKTSSNHVRTTSGSGLGLSIVKEILTLHNAKFGVESKVGKGTTFWFELMLESSTNDRNQQSQPHHLKLINRHR